MGKLLFIDSDDINGLSEALRDALERRGIVFTETEEEPDIDPYLGVTPRFIGSCGGGYPISHCGGGHCGYSGCGYTPSYGGCGGGVNYPRC